MEAWRDVVGYEGRYEVSDQGRVRSLLFRGNGGPRVMKAAANYSGYRVITLGTDRKQFRLHCLVLEAFVGPRPNGQQGCHGDSDKSNNTLGNLRWDTPSGNIADRASYNGQLNPNAKLSDAQRDEIKRRRAVGEECEALGAEFGVSGVRVSQIGRAGVRKGRK